MKIYEENNSLNINFDNLTGNPDISLFKDGDNTSLVLNGKDISSEGRSDKLFVVSFTVDDEGNITPSMSQEEFRNKINDLAAPVFIVDYGVPVTTDFRVFQGAIIISTELDIDPLTHMSINLCWEESEDGPLVSCAVWYPDSWFGCVDEHGKFTPVFEITSPYESEVLKEYCRYKVLESVVVDRTGHILYQYKTDEHKIVETLCDLYKILSDNKLQFRTRETFVDDTYVTFEINSAKIPFDLTEVENLTVHKVEDTSSKDTGNVCHLTLHYKAAEDTDAAPILYKKEADKTGQELYTMLERGPISLDVSVDLGGIGYLSLRLQSEDSAEQARSNECIHFSMIGTAPLSTDHDGRRSYGEVGKIIVSVDSPTKNPGEDIWNFSPNIIKQLMLGEELQRSVRCMQLLSPSDKLYEIRVSDEGVLSAVEIQST